MSASRTWRRTIATSSSVRWFASSAGSMHPGCRNAERQIQVLAPSPTSWPARFTVRDGSSDHGLGMSGVAAATADARHAETEIGSHEEIERDDDAEQEAAREPEVGALAVED